MAELGEVGSLGLLLEKDPDIRARARETKQLTEWPSEETVGIASIPRQLPIDVLRVEAWFLIKLSLVFIGYVFHQSDV